MKVRVWVATILHCFDPGALRDEKLHLGELRPPIPRGAVARILDAALRAGPHLRADLLVANAVMPKTTRSHVAVSDEGG